MFGLFQNSEANRLKQLQKKNSQRLSKIVNATSQSLDRMSPLARKAIVDDVALILNNAEKFSSTDLASACRLCPGMFLRSDSRAPLPPENVRLVMMASHGSLNNSLRRYENPADALVVMNCLQTLGEQTNGTLSQEEIRVRIYLTRTGQQVEVEQEGVASVARNNILAIAQKRRDRSVNEINALLPLLEKVFVNFNHTLSDDDVRALQSVPSDMLNMAVSQARYASERVRPKKSAYNYWNSASRFTGFWRS